MSFSKILVTGGAGFIGSHLVDELLERGNDVVVLDNLSTGSFDNLARSLNNPRFEFVKGDMLKPKDIEGAIEDCDLVFHLAANPEVRIGAFETRVDFEQNVLATYNLLEAMRKSRGCKKIVFTSTSTVYGEPEVMPTPEDYGPLKPISLYGASKLACESLISGYAHMFGFRSAVCRLANIVGPRSQHGVIHDFLEKLSENSAVLEVLGDGTQSKSYLHVEDCVEALWVIAQNLGDPVEIINVGSEDRVDVLKIARMVIEEMGLKEVEIRCTGGIEGGRGWKGDVKKMLLDIGRLKSKGWKPRHTSEESLRLAIRSMIRA